VPGGVCMKSPFEIALWAVGWYGVLAIFAWLWFGHLRSGEAGSSGQRCSRTSEPVWFWFKLSYEGLALAVLAILPLLILWKLASR